MKKGLSKVLVTICCVIVGIIILAQIGSTVNAEGYVGTLRNSDNGSTAGGALTYRMPISILEGGTHHTCFNTFCMKKGGYLRGGYSGYTKTNAYTDTRCNSSTFQWLYDNLYLDYNGGGLYGPVSRNESEIQYFRQNIADIVAVDNANKFNNNSPEYNPNINGTEVFSLTDQQLYKIEQCVLWHYTNNADYSSQLSGISRRVYSAIIAMADHNATKGYTSPNTNNTAVTSINKNAAKFNATTQMVGPFYISNNNSLFQKQITVSVRENNGNAVNKGYQIVNAAGNVISNFSPTKTQILNQEVTPYNDNNGEFYIKIQSNQFNPNQDVEVNIDFILSGYKTTGFYWTKSNWQPLLTLERTNVIEQFSANFVQNKTDLDLALKKTIRNVKDGVTGEVTSYNRFQSIDTTPLDNGANNATYLMKKQPVKVSKGDIVEYEIRIYNESTKTRAIASQIVDYLPEGLELATSESNPVTTSSGTMSYVYNPETKNIVITYTDQEHCPVYVVGSGQLHGRSVFIKCKVTDNATGILTNSAEITRYNYIENDIYKTAQFAQPSSTYINDRDSSIANWNSPNGSYTEYVATVIGQIEANSGRRATSVWRNYSNVQNSWVDDGQFHNFLGQQDDDDFEKVEVEEPDVALKKFIVSVKNDTDGETFSETNAYSEKRLYQVYTELLRMGYDDATYWMYKDPVEVKTGDTVTYAIRIYNEGKPQIAASKISDYLPEGLTYQKAYLKLSGSEEILEVPNFTDIGTSTVPAYVFYNEQQKMVQFTYEGALLDGYNKEVGETLDYYTFYVECTVGTNIERIQTNVAEITEYKTARGIITTDKDSTSKNWAIPDNSELSKLLLADRQNDIWSEYSNGYDLNHLPGWILDNHGQEDDDDFEKIIVKQQYFDLALRKSIASVTKKPGAVGEEVVDYDEAYSETFDADASTRITKRVPTVTENSWSNFATMIEGATTLEYYHAKDAVTVEKGDNITYRIRVYNEGTTKGKVIKIGDYLPEGLVLRTNSTINQQYGWTYTQGFGEEDVETNGFVAIETTLQTENILDPINETEKEVDYIELLVECTMTNDVVTNKYFTNIAEIKEAVALDNNNNELTDLQDFDSEFNSIFEKLEDTSAEGVATIFDEYYEKQGVDRAEYTYFPGQEDDDDFDTIYVFEETNYSYNLKLIKIDAYTKNTLDGIKFKVKGINTLGDTISVNGVQLDGTPEYTTGAVEDPETNSVTYNEKTYSNGIIEINNIPVTRLIPHVFEFTETEIPTEYSYNNMVTAFFKIDFGKNSQGATVPTKIVDLSTDTELELVYLQDSNTVIAIVPNYPEGRYKIGITKTDVSGQTASIITDKPTQFLVKYQSGLSMLYTTQNGKALIENRKITTLGREEYRIKEVIAPTGYIRDSSWIVVTVEKYYDENTHSLEAKVISVVNEDDPTNEQKKCTIISGDSSTAEDSTTLEIAIPNTQMNGEYNVRMKKVDKNDSTKVIGGVHFTVSGPANSRLTTNATTGLTDTIRVPINYGDINSIITTENGELRQTRDQLQITEVDVGGANYYKLVNHITVYVDKGIVNGKYEATRISLDEDVTVHSKYFELENGTWALVNIEIINNIITVTIPNVEIINPDLALEKFITKVSSEITNADGEKEINDVAITNREPEFSKDLTVTDGDGYVYKPAYEDLQPVEVNHNDIVTYTLRIYNEGRINAYAAEVIDDIPDGLEFVPYDAEDAEDTSVNKQYRWVMYKEVTDTEIAQLPEGTAVKQLDGKTKDGETVYKKCIITTDPKEADYIVTDYLSKEQGEARMATTDTVNPNLLTAFNPEAENAMTEGPDYRDLKIEFKVTRSVTNKEDAEKTIVNYAQITKETDEDGEDAEDVDSTPNIWKDGEDDQDREKIKVKYFDLALVKWVSEAIIVEDGVERVEQGNKLEELKNQDDHRLIYALYPDTIGDYTDLEPVVKVDIPKSKIDSTVVKFKYQIRVSNQGKIDGYVKEITDYVPTGMKFVQEDNPLWKDAGDGKIVTDQLADTLLTVDGEAKTVEIIYTWINSENNLGLIVNMAEISRDYNDSNSPDIDSTPNNLQVGEDDIDDAAVLLSVRTGNKVDPTYIVLTVAIVGLIATGTVLIKKFVL